MPLATELIEAIETVLMDAYRAGGDPLIVLRRHYPNVNFSRCEANDVIEPPHRENNWFNLYLVDDSGHCPCITLDLTHANRILIGDK